MAWSTDMQARLAVLDGYLQGVSMLLGCLIDQLDPEQRKRLGEAFGHGLEEIQATLLHEAEKDIEHNIQGLEHARGYFFGGEPPPDASPRSEPP